jgi:hypothetical protein
LLFPRFLAVSFVSANRSNLSDCHKNLGYSDYPGGNNDSNLPDYDENLGYSDYPEGNNGSNLG